MSKKRRSETGQKISSSLATAFLCWLTWTSAHALVGVFRAGTILNRRGPDIDMRDSPILFWVLGGFFTIGVILVTGLTVICILHLLALFRGSGSNPDR
jgi:hypothetical protein